jgi:hypothetical protein
MAPPAGDDAHDLVSERMRNIGTVPHAGGMHYDPISRWERAYIGAISMVYSSRSGRAPKTLLV